MTSARAIDLKESPAHPTGYWAEEALKSYERFVAAGFDVVVITPDGNKPVPDPYGLESFFHYPDEDRDYYASIYRTFHRDPDDIRITLDQTIKQELVAARRIAALMVAGGKTEDQAHALLSEAGKIAWRQKRMLSEVLLTAGLHGGLSEAAIKGAVEDLRAASQAISDARKAKLESIPGFNKPAALSSFSDEQFAQFDAVFVPGGHGPMVDLPDNADLRRLLGILHERGKVIGSLCHGPAMLLSAADRQDGQWLFEGYRFTAYTNDEENQNAIGRLGMPWFLTDALQNAGGILDDAPYAWASHVVVDRNLITGQNPNSTEATADAVIKALATATA